MPEKLDYKKQYKDLYMPGKKPMAVDVPDMTFMMVDGAGDPNGEVYQKAVSALYALTFTIKMSKMGGGAPAGYFEYVVPPLEGLWWSEGPFDFDQRGAWRWTSMIRQPEFVTQEVFDWAVAQCKQKKPDIDVSAARLESFTEGLCVQVMHIGPYADEPASVELMHAYMEQNGLRDDTGLERKHHEIYLGDPRKTAPEKLRTVLRHPVARI